VNRFILGNGIIHFPALAALVMTAGAATWSNSDSNEPPDETQNWNLDGNWNTNVVPVNEEVRISNGGAALINTSVPDITIFLIGNSGVASLAHSLTIDVGGSLTVTDPGAQAFRLFNTEGMHRVSVAEGGTLTVAGGLVNGATISEYGSESFFNSAGTAKVGSFATSRNAVTEISGGIFSTNSASVSGGAVFQVTGGSVSVTEGSFRLFENGTVKISGGSFSVEGGSGLFFFGASEGVSGPRTFHVDGSGASDISLDGVRYFADADRKNAVWKFTLDNGADHITPVILTANGNQGTTLRDGTTLEVGLRGGILLSGTDTFTLIERPGSAYSNYTDFWAAGPGPLWTEVTDGITIQVALNPEVGMGSLDASKAGASVKFAATSTGHIALTGLSGKQTRLRLKLHWSAGSGASISGFTALLEAAGITCGEISASEIGVELTPSLSGASFFAWDLEASGVAGMLEGITVIQAP
jgi:hypothetical protein